MTGGLSPACGDRRPPDLVPPGRPSAWTSFFGSVSGAAPPRSRWIEGRPSPSELLPHLADACVGRKQPLGLGLRRVRLPISSGGAQERHQADTHGGIRRQERDEDRELIGSLAVASGA